MNIFVRKKGVRRKRRRWLRKSLIVLATIVLIVAVAAGIFLANLKGIVLRVLRASLPGLRVSVEKVSLKSLSLLRIRGLKIEGERGERGSVIKLPRADVRFRLSLLDGITLTSLDLDGANVLLRPGIGAIVSSVGTGGKKAEAGPAGTFPSGPSIGRIALRNSRVSINMPDFKADGSLNAFADSSSTGTLLDDTGLSFRLQIVSLEAPFLRLKNVATDLSLFVDRAATGKQVDIQRGALKLGDFLRSDFRGQLTYAGKNLEATGDLTIEPFALAALVPYVKESFPDIESHQIHGMSGARLVLRYSPEQQEQLLVSGDLSLRDVGAVLRLSKPMVVEKVEADLPFRYTVGKDRTALSLGGHQEHPAGATVTAARIVYDDKEIASSLLASFALEDEVLKSLEASLESHGGTVHTRLSGDLRGGDVQLQGDVELQGIDLGRLVELVGAGDLDVGGKLSAKAAAVLRSANSGEKRTVTVSGEASASIPEGVVYFKKPLKVSGLELGSPFEYRLATGVQTFEVKRTDGYPSGGKMTAAEIRYGGEAADGGSGSEWTAADLAATVVSSDEGVEFSITSCRAYEGDITGSVAAFWEKETLALRGELDVDNLDLGKLARALGAKEEKLEVKGKAEGKLTVSVRGGKWEMVDGQFSSLPPGGMVRIEGKREIAYKVARASVLYPPVEPRPEGATGFDIQLHFEGAGTGESLEKLLDHLNAGKVVLEQVKKQQTPQQWMTLIRDWDITVQIPVTLEKGQPPAGSSP